MQEELAQILKQQLRDVHVPEAVSWWPPAPGWWILALFGVCLIGLLTRKVIQQQRQNRYRHTAISELTHYFQEYQTERDALVYLQHANSVLKRCVLHVDANAINTRASGDQWVSILETLGGLMFSAEARLALGHSIYQPQKSLDIEAIHPQLLDWVNNHRPSVESKETQSQPGAYHA